MRYKPLDIRKTPLAPYSDRTLLYQRMAYLDKRDGVCKMPLLEKLSLNRTSSILFTCPVMHNLRGTLRVAYSF